MRIINSDIRFEVEHRLQRDEAVGMAGRRRVSNQGIAGQAAGARLAISQAAKDYYQSDQAFSLFGSQEVSNIPKSEGVSSNPDTAQLISAMSRTLFGRNVRVTEIMARTETGPAAPSGATAPDGSSQADGGQLNIRFLEVKTVVENETIDLFSTGVIRTGEGVEIKFDLQLQLARAFQSRETALREVTFGTAIDPLVVTLDGGPPKIADTFFTFDLNADGQAESVSALGQGSGFLALDRNGDGLINNGAELFGPQSGDGFLELSLFDQDGNRWIDESDPIYSQLSVWQRDENGKDLLMNLKDAGIGAIHLQTAETSFSMTGERNQVSGQLRRTGIMVKEGGEVRHIYQVDLSQRPASSEPERIEPSQGETDLRATVVSTPASVSGRNPARSFFLGVPTRASDAAEKESVDSMIETMKKRFEQLKEEIEKMQQETLRKVKATAARAVDSYGRYAANKWSRAAPYPSKPR